MYFTVFVGNGSACFYEDHTDAKQGSTGLLLREKKYISTSERWL
jgi:hypothetical protein